MFAKFEDIPPYYNRSNDSFYDEGQGVPKIKESTMTVQDVYRTPFLFLQEHIKDYKRLGERALSNLQSQTSLSKMFFSEKNMKRLQILLKNEVLVRTNGQFKLDVDQDEKSLFIVMRAVYMEYARFIPTYLLRQVKRLNNKVIDSVIPSVITEIRQNHYYLKDINSPIKPNSRPLNVSNKGRKTLPSVSTVLGM